MISTTNSMSVVQKKVSTSTKNVSETKKRHPKKVVGSEGLTSIKYINNSDLVTQLGNALVREYLSRHGCKKSLAALIEYDEKELSETSKKTYNSRTELAKSLGILKHAQQNKNSKTVYLSLLEVAINAVLLELPNNQKEEKNSSKSNTISTTTTTKEKNSHSSKNKDSDKNNYPYTSSTSLSNEHHSEHESKKTKAVNTPSSNSHSSQQITATTISVAKASPAAPNYSFSFSKSNPSYSRSKLTTNENDLNQNIKKTSHSSNHHNSHNHNHDLGYDSQLSSSTANINGFMKPKSHKKNSHSISVQEDDMLIEDIQIQDFDLAENDININYTSSTLNNNNSSMNIWKNQGKPISTETSKNLLNLVYGDTKENYQDSWKGKRLSFNRNSSVSYGLIQEKGGPCGLISVVQAYVILHLAFKNTKYENVDEEVLHSFTDGEKEDALINSLADIIWKSGEWNHCCIIALPSPNSISKNLAENLTLYNIYSRDACYNFISQNLNQMQVHAFLILLYSTILSRGIDNVRNDMDEPNNTLIGMHGYCTQDLVNLLITGKAISNVHDNDIRLGDDGAPDEECKILKGIKSQPNIGHLSLFEHYRSIIVGSYYKNPKYPIFIVCSESHYTVLFSLDKDVVSTKRKISMFDLFYYDQLSNQQDEIKLTITLLNDTYHDDDNGEIIDHHKKLVPPLNLCIKTKWKNVNIDWNDTDPLL
ncbi:hypothetical protein BCR36DRAFT_416592 [Piromyces finnis]|uniref:Probable ubiquitin carboxyl-terminal hydrolase MINDY-4 n=1 Tax=Piromyces finnis TaxID=1754191 RepID=A0A1Y1UVQ5_9FUNG|nr:hypothetical protein BCR36DRAFT_416592 [Piromyces finnis]|eukprot:ORX41697.1 hypothetical protein BCR36DRAFT_416592 [Piromyces finnis]